MFFFVEISFFAPFCAQNQRQKKNANHDDGLIIRIGSNLNRRIFWQVFSTKN